MSVEDDGSPLADDRETVRRTTPVGWSMLAVLGGGLIAGGLGLTGDTVAIGAAVLALGATFLLATPFALAICLIVVGVIAPTDLVTLLITGSGLFVVGLAGLDIAPNALLGSSIFALVSALALGSVALAWTTWPPWLATLAVLVGIATLGYATHRYERVMLGLVTENGSEAER